MLTNVQKSFTDRFNSKFAVKCSLTIPPHLNCFTTLPCEISVLKIVMCHAQDLSVQGGPKNGATLIFFKQLSPKLADFSNFWYTLPLTTLSVGHQR